jgi:hypothetical protein
LSDLGGCINTFGGSGISTLVIILGVQPAMNRSEISAMILTSSLLSMGSLLILAIE